MTKKPLVLIGAPDEFTVTIEAPDGSQVFQEKATFRLYKTGSYGWHTAGKFEIPDVIEQRAQVNVGLTVIGSKQWPLEVLRAED